MCPTLEHINNMMHEQRPFAEQVILKFSSCYQYYLIKSSHFL
ncbi:hypothetical protein LDG_5843 [Legionella drancourtii LLAP12]|uniref:Uncharacterized protein n=1 Tax=Legionella drancourtii LLAP12 TaxID=658187 RepID=G9EKV2_9GAMM|nr:hypothetical protein LDG_5843 [Legionella drancourtii LLAP12]